jgi:hypothetical protein
MKFLGHIEEIFEIRTRGIVLVMDQPLVLNQLFHPEGDYLELRQDGVIVKRFFHWSFEEMLRNGSAKFTILVHNKKNRKISIEIGLEVWQIES